MEHSDLRKFAIEGACGMLRIVELVSDAETKTTLSVLEELGNKHRKTNKQTCFKFGQGYNALAMFRSFVNFKTLKI